MMNIRPIRDEASHAWALKEIERYFEREPEPGSPDGNRFDVLATLIEAYEAKRYPIPAAAPLDVLRFVMEQSGRTQSDLAELLGSRSRASEILAGARGLTVAMIDQLNRHWGVPAELLVRQTDAVAA